MIRPRHTAAVLAAALCLGAPAVALAQSAGDDQYSDPLAGSNTTTSKTQTSTGSSDSLGQTPPSSSSSGSSGSSGSTSAGSTSSGTAATPTAATTTAVPAASTTSGQLPNTGADAWLVALLGAGLLVGGVGLRLRARDGRFRDVRCRADRGARRRARPHAERR